MGFAIDMLRMRTAAAPAGAAPPIRVSGITAGSASSVTVSFSGASAGDRAIIHLSGAFKATCPSGWDAIQQGAGSSINGSAITKVLTSGDISTGSVTISFAGSGSELAEWVFFIGNAVIHGCTLTRNLASGGTLASWTAGQIGDMLLWFGGEVGASGATGISRGSSLQVRASTPWGRITNETLAATGSLTATYTSTGFLTTAAVTVGPVTTTTLTVRGQRITSFSAASVAYTFPAGSVAGDMCIIATGHAFAVTTPAGWTQLDNSTGSNWNGALFYKTLSAGDISTGTVTISFAGSFNGVVDGVTLVGAPTSVRTSAVLRSAGSSAPGTTVTTGSSPVSGDVAFYFGSVRGSGAVYPTINRGSVLAKDNTSGGPGILGQEVLTTGGAVSAMFSYIESTATGGDYQAIVVIQP